MSYYILYLHFYFFSIIFKNNINYLNNMQSLIKCKTFLIIFSYLINIEFLTLKIIWLNKKYISYWLLLSIKAKSN